MGTMIWLNLANLSSVSTGGVSTDGRKRGRAGAISMHALLNRNQMLANKEEGRGKLLSYVINIWFFGVTH